MKVRPSNIGLPKLVYFLDHRLGTIRVVFRTRCAKLDNKPQLLAGVDEGAEALRDGAATNNISEREIT